MDTFKVGDRVRMAWASPKNDRLRDGKACSDRRNYGEPFDKRLIGTIDRLDTDFGLGRLATVTFDTGRVSCLFVDRLEKVHAPFKPGDRVEWTKEQKQDESNRQAFGHIAAYQQRKHGTVQRLDVPGGGGVNMYVRFDGESSDQYVHSTRLVAEQPVDAPAPPLPLPASDFKVGDRVQFHRGTLGSDGLGLDTPLRRMYEADVHGTIEGIPSQTFVNVRFDSDQEVRNAYASRFKKEEPTMVVTNLSGATNSTSPARAMTFAAAIEARKRVLAATGLPAKDVTVRTRSWAYDGLYGAVEIPAQSVKLYTEGAVQEYLDNLTPIDVLGEKRYGGYYTFRLSDGTPVLAPDKSDVWTPLEIRSAKGIATMNGRKYRLCIEVKATKPLFDTQTGDLTKL